MPELRTPSGLTETAAEELSKSQTLDTAPDVGGVGSDIQTLSDLGFLPDQGQFASSVDLLQQQKTDRIGSAVTGAQREFDDPLREARENIEKVRGGATAQATRLSGGLGLDTATQGFIQSQVDIAQKAVTELEKKRDEAMRNAKLDTAAEYDDLILAENKRISDLRQQTFENLLKVGTARRAGTQLDISTVNALRGVSEGQTVVIGGQTFTGLAKEEINPFFTGSNIVSLMKTIPMGETTEIEDPNTGTIMTLTGLASDDPNTSTIQSTDPSGNVTITTIDKDTGKLINQVSAGQIGKGFKETTTPEIANTFQSDLLKEIEKLKKGDFGVDGAREKLIESLKATARVKYPELVDMIDDIIYGSDEFEAVLPDGYETLIGGGLSVGGGGFNFEDF